MKNLLNRFYENLQNLVETRLRGWPIWSLAIGLFVVFAFTAAAVLQSTFLLALRGGGTLELILFAVTVLTGAAATLTLHLAFRQSNIEVALRKLRDLIAEFDQKLGEIGDVALLIRQVLAASDGRIVKDDINLWSRVVTYYQAIMPQFRSEVQTVVRDGLVAFDFSVRHIALWANRIRTGKVEILITPGHLSRINGVIAFKENSYNLHHLVRVIAFLLEVAKERGVKKDDIFIYLGTKPLMELKSTFRCELTTEFGQVRPAYLLYTNARLEGDEGSGRVGVFHEPAALAEGDAVWRESKRGAYRWSLDQLANRFADYLPSGRSGEWRPLVPEDLQFDPTNPFEYEEDHSVVAGDHFVFGRRRGRNTPSNRPHETGVQARAAEDDIRNRG